jgi:hypothetical protein
MNSSELDAAWKELNLAQQNQINGFMGRSRVCSRRAAGAAINIYLLDTQQSYIPCSAFDALVFIQTMGEIPLNIVDSARKLTLRVDENFNLPSEIDPVQAATVIIKWVEEYLNKSENYGNTES